MKAVPRRICPAICILLLASASMSAQSDSNAPSSRQDQSGQPSTQSQNQDKDQSQSQGQDQNKGQTQKTPQSKLPDAPSSTSKEPSLGDLGFSTTETQPNPQLQALLNKRTHMLKIHQRMGLITAIPMMAALFSSAGAGGKHSGSATRDLHVALGAAAGDLYGITAYYAIRAPKPPGTPTKGPIKFHKAMAWIHGPGMIMTPILGAIAFSQKNNGEKVHGIAQAHMPVAIVTAGAFGAALMAVSVKF